MYLVTGSTGFIGKQLIALLLRKRGTIHIIVRENQRKLIQEIAERLGKDLSGRIQPILGDITRTLCGLSEARIAELKESVEHFYHLAALYDLNAKAEEVEAINVGGTANAVALANELGCAFHHCSSLSVSGDYEGVFTEDMLDEGLSHPTVYARTKFEAEKVVRENGQEEKPSPESIAFSYLPRGVHS